MLFGVMAIIIFSVSEIGEPKKQKFTECTLLLLTFFTLMVNLIALSAIIYRLAEFGFTPNRIVMVGWNVLIFGNLIWIFTDLFKINLKNVNINVLETSIARYLPLYFGWLIFVVFVLPLVFGFN